MKDNCGTVSEKNTMYFHPDHLGSSSYVTDKKGNFFEMIEYLPYGETLYDEAATVDKTEFRFTGHLKDDETGFYYCHARYYDPKIGKFLTPDDRIDGLFSSAGQNMYMYCHGNPINMVDPDGHSQKDAESQELASVGIITERHAINVTKGGAGSLPDNFEEMREKQRTGPQSIQNSQSTTSNSDVDIKENLIYNNQVMPIPKSCGEKSIGSPAGERGEIPGVMGPNFHAGQDYKTPIGTPYLATDSGEVIDLRFISGNDKTTGEGNFIKIKYGDIICMGMHLSKIYVSKGDKISLGQVIALTGNSGTWTSGPHLHEGRFQINNYNKVWSVKENNWIDREYYDKKTESFKLSK